MHIRVIRLQSKNKDFKLILYHALGRENKGPWTKKEHRIKFWKERQKEKTMKILRFPYTYPEHSWIEAGVQVGVVPALINSNLKQNSLVHCIRNNICSAIKSITSNFSQYLNSGYFVMQRLLEKYHLRLNNDLHFVS